VNAHFPRLRLEEEVPAVGAALCVGNAARSHGCCHLKTALKRAAGYAKPRRREALVPGCASDRKTQVRPNDKVESRYSRELLSHHQSVLNQFLEKPLPVTALARLS